MLEIFPCYFTCCFWDFLFRNLRFFFVATRLLMRLGAVHLLPHLYALCVHFDCCIYHLAAVLYIMVIGKWMSSAGLMCIPCHMFQSFIKIKTRLSAQWTPTDARFLFLVLSARKPLPPDELLFHLCVCMWEKFADVTVNAEPGWCNGESRLSIHFLHRIDLNVCSLFQISFWIERSPLPPTATTATLPSPSTSVMKRVALSTPEVLRHVG